MKKASVFWCAFVAVVTVVVVVLGTVGKAQAKLRPCPPPVGCLDVWDPVICSNGQVYSNMCYARNACQTDCHPL